MATVDWVAADWGTSHLRLWLIGRDGRVIDRLDSDRGMASLAPEGYEPEILRLIGDRLPAGGVLPVICCGMAGARQGWAEAPYVAVPAAPPGLAEARRVATRDPRLTVFILPGMKQQAPAEVMRGEETQIAGFLAAEPDFDGVLCLPGTHCKWVHISAGEVVSFRTAMTGELFALLGTQSVLRHSLGTTGWDDAAFAAAVNEAMAQPAALAFNLFSLRARSLLSGLAPETARARLSGLLIGMELAAARAYWLGRAVVILAEGGIASAYGAALAAQGAAPRAVDAEEMTLGGLRAARATLGGPDAAGTTLGGLDAAGATPGKDRT
ncbi:MAG: 2-keto-3-deoxy-galactonokinase [Alphaproteobacteria bacterium HGW-Alphaproteobacteria-6]|nr:MAG: 2-keto-3-deoxy-galactonokinase [Alphaproteobacteria bacterium HGW-Alphaproteobacteria-6]